MSGQPLDAGDLSTRLRLQAGHCLRLGSPLYADLLRRAADDAEEGGPVAELLRGHEDDRVDSMLALRLMGAVHRRVLEGRLPELKSEAWPALRAALVEDAEAIRQLLDRPVQTNEVGRCAALLPGFFSVARETRMPLRLLEVGASAGLNLRWDRYRYEADGFSWGDADSPVRLRFQVEGAPPQPTEVTAARMREAGARADAGAPLAWLRMEPAGEQAEVRLTIWPDGEDKVIARAGYHGDLVDLRRAV